MASVNCPFDEIYRHLRDGPLGISVENYLDCFSQCWEDPLPVSVSSHGLNVKLNANIHYLCILTMDEM